MWLKNIMGELGYQLQPIKLYYNNESAISLSKNPTQYHKSRHYQLSWHLVRQVQEARETQVGFVKYGMQDVDVLTKALTVRVHYQAAERLGQDFSKTKLEAKSKTQGT